METAISVISLVLGLIMLGGGSALMVMLERGIIKDPKKKSFEKKDWIRYGLTVGVIAVGGLFMQLALNYANPSWAHKEGANYALDGAAMYLGTFFFTMFMTTLWTGFTFRYYKKGFEPLTKKIFDYFLFGSIPLALIFFVMALSGLGSYLTYPLISGFVIDGSGWHWITPETLKSYNGLHVAFYGIIIIFGVAVCYWISDHKFYKRYGKHGILDTVAIVAFAAGIIGARLWYVVGNWEREGFNVDPGKIIRIWDGGLTIIGGAAGGILVGVLFVMIFRKFVDVRWAMDVIVPTILLAQAIGRWGNFFNCEVYGFPVKVSDFTWLPSFIVNQMQQGGTLDPGMMHLPLFLIEGALNVAGYFIIVYGIGKPLRKYLATGDLAGAYFIWYGAVRLPLETLRDADFNMGNDNSFSIWGSLNYIIIGAALILLFHLYDLRKKGSFKIAPLIAGGVLGLGALLTPAAQGYVVANSSTHEIVSQEIGFYYIIGGNAKGALATAYVFLVLGLLAFVGAALYEFLNQTEESKKISRYIYLGSALLCAIGGIMFMLAKQIIGTPDENYTYSTSAGTILPGMLGLILAILSLLPWIEIFAKKIQGKGKEEAKAEPTEAK